MTASTFVREPYPGMGEPQREALARIVARLAEHLRLPDGDDPDEGRGE